MVILHKFHIQPSVILFTLYKETWLSWLYKVLATNAWPSPESIHLYKANKLHKIYLLDFTLNSIYVLIVVTSYNTEYIVAQNNIHLVKR